MPEAYEWIGPAIVALITLVIFVVLGVGIRRARQQALRRGAPPAEPARVGTAAAEQRPASAEQPAPVAEHPEPGPAQPGPVAEQPEPGPAQPAAVAEPAAAAPAPEAVERPLPAEQPVAAEPRVDLSEGLAKTHSSLWSRLGQLFSREQVDEKVLDELEEVLLTADVGVKLTMSLVDDLRGKLKANGLDSPEAVRRALKETVQASMQTEGAGGDPLALHREQKPRVILFVGVNGVGKTTTIGKVASKLRARDENVVLAAGDTFRAAAVEQLGIWAERTGARLIRGESGADPASVIFNAIDHAKSTGADTVLADTAGRLHTKKELMDEIQKVKRAANKAREGAPDETWLVVDATTGQNALQQAKEFDAALKLSGIILTKLDGTAKGGIVVAIADALGLPVRFVGVGEKPEDLRMFEPQAFVNALFDA